MQIDVANMERLYAESKFWIGLTGFLWAVFNGVQWVKAIKTNDLPHIQAGVDSLHAEVKEQTEKVVGELRELRNDVRNNTTAVTAAVTAAVASKRSPRR